MRAAKGMSMIKFFLSLSQLLTSFRDAHSFTRVLLIQIWCVLIKLWNYTHEEWEHDAFGDDVVKLKFISTILWSNTHSLRVIVDAVNRNYDVKLNIFMAREGPFFWRNLGWWWWLNHCWNCVMLKENNLPNLHTIFIFSASKRGLMTHLIHSTWYLGLMDMKKRVSEVRWKMNEDDKLDHI